MKKIFLGQAVKGQDKEILEAESQQLREVFRRSGYDMIHIVDYPQDVLEWKKRDRLGQYAFGKIDECEEFFAVVRTEDKSEGQLMELGHVLNTDMPITLAIQEDVKDTYLPEIADRTLRFRDFPDLLGKVEETYL